MKTRMAMALVALLSTACDMNFTEAYEVDEPRLMAARVEVKGAPERAWPGVGEEFTMRVQVARSNQATNLPLDRQLDGAVSVCLGGKLPSGALFCVAELSLSTLQGDERKNSVVSFEELDIPLSFGPADPRDFGGGSDVLLFGAICVEGKVERVKAKVAGKDPANELFRCVDNEKAELQDPLAFTNVVTVDFDDDEIPANLNPSFFCDGTKEDTLCKAGSVRDGEQTRGGAFVLVRPRPKKAPETARREVVEWPEVLPAPTEPIAYEGCAKDPRFDALKVKAGSGEHLIRVRFDAEDREQYMLTRKRLNKIETISTREELLVSHAATKDVGALARFFSVVPINAKDSEAEIEVEYEAPGQSTDPATRIPDDGKLVRFYFAVRDQRGGVDFTTRSLCVVP